MEPRKLPRVTIETLSAICHDLAQERTTLARCLNEIAVENPVVHAWIINMRDTETILRVVLMYKMLKSQSENDDIMDSLKS